jgi:phosphoglycerate dehydrogenase-like enzyme
VSVGRQATGPAPIALFIDRGFDVGPFAAALEPHLRCLEHATADEADAVAAIVTGIERVSAQEVAPYPNLRVVLTCSVGTDHLDLDALRRRGLVVCNTPRYCTEEVADHALACVLGGWRRLWGLGDEVRLGGWEPSTILRRFDAQRLGVIGVGSIGRALARGALALGVDVVAHDPWADPPPGVAGVGLDELLRSSDAVSLHVPGRPGAPPLLGAAEIAVMKPGAVLVNTARASLVDLDAALAALRSGHLGAVAWDVWPNEPPAPGDSRLATPGLLVTPHVGWSSPQADRAYLDEAIEALRASVLEGKEPPSRVI